MPVDNQKVINLTAFQHEKSWLFLHLSNLCNKDRGKLTMFYDYLEFAQGYSSLPDAQSYVKYRGRSPKFIWAPCHVMCTAVLFGWDQRPRNSLPPPAFGLIFRGRYWSAKIDDISLYLLCSVLCRMNILVIYNKKKTGDCFFLDIKRLLCLTVSLPFILRTTHCYPAEYHSSYTESTRNKDQRVDSESARVIQGFCCITLCWLISYCAH